MTKHMYNRGTNEGTKGAYAYDRFFRHADVRDGGSKKTNGVFVLSRALLCHPVSSLVEYSGEILMHTCSRMEFSFALDLTTSTYSI